MIAWIAIAFAGNFDAVDGATSPSAKADLLHEILQDDAQEEVHGEAWARLAQALASAGHNGAALVAWSHAFEDEGQLQHLPTAIALADKVGDHAVVAEPVTDHEGFEPKGDAMDRAAYVVARHLLRRDRLGPALDWATKVGNQSPSFADAETIRAIVLASQGNHKAALAPMQTARALGKSQDRGRRYDDKMLINLARAYYAEGNLGQSIYHYTIVPRDSEYWAQASFERAWAHFRGGDLPGALGQLETHTSPFFAQAWYPEAYLLKAQGEFLMCKFASALETMDAFEKRYEPVLEDLDRDLGKLDARGAFDAVATYLDTGESTLPGSMLRRYRTEDRIEEARQAITFYEDEAKRVTSFGKDGTTYAGWLTDRAEAIRTSEGARIESWLDSEREALETQLTGLELTRVDILQLESQLYERASATGKLEHGDRIGKLRDMRKSKRGFHVWPFQGEYWADELGWFVVDARSDCPESMARKIEAK